MIEDAKFQDLRLRLRHRLLLSRDRGGVKGKTLEPSWPAHQRRLAEELALPPVKIHCSILAEDAIKAAINDYRNKQSKE